LVVQAPNNRHPPERSSPEGRGVGVSPPPVGLTGPQCRQILKKRARIKPRPTDYRQRPNQRSPMPPRTGPLMRQLPVCFFGPTRARFRKIVYFGTTASRIKNTVDPVGSPAKEGPRPRAPALPCGPEIGPQVFGTARLSPQIKVTPSAKRQQPPGCAPRSVK